MKQPQGFVDATHPDYVCKLHKSLYGLKQAYRAWFTQLSYSLIDLGFTASLVDNSLFLYHSGSIYLFILTYVDDIIITETHSSMIFSIIQQMQCKFILKDLDPLSFFLGVQAT